MKRCTAVILLIAFPALLVYPQKLNNSGLAFTGTVLSVSSTSHDGKQQFKVRLQLQVRNDSDTPLLVLLPATFMMGQRKIDFLKKLASGSDDEIGTSKVIPWLNPYGSSKHDYDPYPSFVRALDVLEPSKYVRIIEPGGYYEFGDLIAVDCCYELDVEPGQKGIDLQSKTPTSEFPALRIEYHLSLKKHHKDTDFLRTLQRRWKRFGHLVLDGSGDFTVRSEAIVNKSGE